MDIKQITETYWVAPQLDPSDLAAAAEAGIEVIVANRPDAEIPPSHHADVMQKAAEAAGLAFVHLPITHQTMTAEAVSAQAEAIDGKRALAYCASGTRSTVIWAMGAATQGQMRVDDIISAAAAGGYDLSSMRPLLDSLSPGQSR